MTTFVVVDVETTSTSPWNGQLLTLGAAAVVDGKLVDTFYRRASYLPIDKGGEFDADTVAWWDEQDEEVYAEAFAWDRDRISSYSLACQLQEWVKVIPGEEKYFAANPSSFDWNWLDKLFVQANLIIPFHYRTMCLRSADFGKQLGKQLDVFWAESNDPPEWGGKRPAHNVSKVPHHALYDAIAEAEDLIELLR